MPGDIVGGPVVEDVESLGTIVTPLHGYQQRVQEHNIAGSGLSDVARDVG